MITGFLDRILSRYANTFDLTRPYVINGTEYAAYGFFFKKDEHYVAIKRATLWSFHQTEHVLFAEAERADESLFQKMGDAALSHIEPDLIRGGNKYPEKDHMESLITLVLISNHTPDERLVRDIKKYRYFKSYLFHFRGHTRARAVLVDLEGGSVVTSRDARDLGSYYRDVLKKHLKKNNNAKIVDFHIRKEELKEEKTV